MRYAYMFVVIFLATAAMLLVKRRHLSLPYACALPLLSYYIMISVGPFNIWATDILSVVAIAIVIARGGYKKPFRLGWPDILLPLPGLWFGLGLLVNGEAPLQAIESTWRWTAPWALPYFVARMGVASWEGMKGILKAMIFFGSVISVLIAVEALTGKNPFVSAGIFVPSGFGRYFKFGLQRAAGSMGSIHIAGMYLAVLAGISLSFWFSRRSGDRRWGYAFIPLAVGTFCSTSATGIMQGVIILSFIALYPLRKYWMIWVGAILAGTLFVEIVSNRHFYHVYLGHLGGMGAGYYRAMMIDELFGGLMQGHWFFGYGSEEVYLSFTSYEDLCSQWMFNMAKGGLPCLLFLFAFYVFVCIRVRQAYRMLFYSKGHRIFIWTILSVLVALFLAFWLIALYGSDITMFSYLFGMIITLPGLASAEAARQNREAERSGALRNSISRRPGPFFMPLHLRGGPRWRRVDPAPSGGSAQA